MRLGPGLGRGLGAGGGPGIAGLAMLATAVLWTGALASPRGADLAATHGAHVGVGAPFGAVHDFPRFPAAQVELGRLLMFDKILSGNRNVSCATCHHPLAGTGDGLSLPVGEGGRGLGVARDPGSGGELIHERVPRNSPPVFNLGDRSIHSLFHDGRVTTVGGEGHPSGCVTPAGADLPDGLENLLACQAMFPVTSATEMAGQPGENPIADAAAAGDLAGSAGVWALLARRLRSIPGYVERFEAAYPDQVSGPGDITFVMAANAIAAFEATSWRCTDSPFDRFLRGERRAMSANARLGMRLFYRGRGRARACASCHSGLYQTDQDYHAIAMPQIGPGRGSDGPGRSGGREDFGREQVTGARSDTLKFRTPSLRNVALTAPYGHSGAYDSLRAVVEHHLDPVAALYAYDARREAVLPAHPELGESDYAAMDDPEIVRFIAEHNELEPMAYRERDVDRIIDFLHALTDPSCMDLRRDVDVVEGVPSGLPLAD